MAPAFPRPLLRTHLRNRAAALTALTLAVLLLSAAGRSAGSAGPDRRPALTDLIEQVVGPGPAASFNTASPDRQAAFLDSFLSHHNPLIGKFYIGPILGRSRYSVSNAFFETGDLIPKHYASGSVPPDPGDVDEAVTLLGRAIRKTPDDPVAHAALGYALLEQGDAKKAEQRFLRAVKLRDDFAEARNGWGLAYLKQKKRMAEALRFFRDAVAQDPGYEGAWYSLAMCHLAMGAIDIDHRFRQVVSRFPAHHDAHYKLGVAYEELYEDRLAAGAYSAQIRVNPGHRLAQDRLARVNLEMGWSSGLRRSATALEPLVDRDRLRYLPILAETHLAEKRYEEAAEAYARYLRLLPDAEAGLYENISLLLTDKQERELGRLEGRARDRYLAGFWLGVDPTPTTPVNERRLEHYRRVHYAVQNYGGGHRPWDVRGDVYIRFGHPNHRSWSGNVVLETEPDVVRVKNRLNDLTSRARWEILPSDYATSDVLFGSADMREVRGMPVFPVPHRGGGSRFNEGASLDGGWELWIYGSAGGGMEVTFVDYRGDGVFEFARVPATSPNALLWLQMAPETVVARAVAQSPSTYTYDYGGEPFDLFVTSADFDAPGDASALELYAGVPWSALGLSMVDGVLRASVDRKAVIYDADGRVVFEDSARIESRVPEDGGSRLFVDQVRALLPPGAYSSAIGMRDPATGHLQAFRLSTVVRAFPPGEFSLSGLEVASRIEPSTERSPFLKGGLHVLPEPSLSFAAGRPIHLYYEVYGLVPSMNGSTRYRIDYRVRGAEASGVRRLLGTAGRLIGVETERGESRVSYVHEGASPDEAIFVAIDVEPLQGDLFEITVAVTDLHRTDAPTVAQSTRVRIEP